MGDRVYLKSAPPWPFGSIARDFARSFLLYTGVDPLNLGSHEGKGYLLRLMAFDASQTLQAPAPPWPFGSTGRKAPRYWTSTGKVTTTYPAATGNSARSSIPTDTPANTWVPGKLSGAFNYEINLFAGADPTSNGGATIGVLELDDPDGELDALRALGWDGAPLQLLRGDPEALFSAFTVVASLSTAGILYDAQKKQIKLRDLAWQMNAELHGQRFGGAGGADGDATLAGIIKPYCVGQVFNISPVQINATALIYQVSCSSVLAIDAVRDGGALPGLTFDADYATYDLLAANAPPAGHYATCLALGLFRIGAAAVFQITADVRGDNDTINGLGYPATRATIARRIATGRGNVRIADPAGIDGAAHKALEQRQAATLGYYWNGENTKAAALKEVMDGCLGWWCIRLNGLLAYGQIEDPATSAATFSLTYPTDANDGEVRVGEPAMVDYPVRRRSTLMGFARNYTVMAVNQIATGVPQVTSLIYQAETRFTTSGDAWVSSAYPTAIVQTVAGGFAFQADAQVEGNRQQSLFRAIREAFEIPAAIDPFSDVVARVIAIKNANRLGLGASRNLFCSGIAVNANGVPVLRLWG